MTLIGKRVRVDLRNGTSYDGIIAAVAPDVGQGFALLVLRDDGTMRSPYVSYCTIVADDGSPYR